MAQGRFYWFDITLTIVSLLTLLLDVGTDVYVAVQFYLAGHVVWGSLMVALTLVPLVVMNVFSLKWHSTDGSLTCPIVLLHVCLFAPVQRYLRVIWLGIKACITGHARFTDAALRGQNDASILRLFETFLESAPQLVLQLYIMLKDPNHIDWIKGLSAGSSLVSLAWALTAYCDTSRLNYQTAYRRRFLALWVHGLWQLLMAASRVAALVLFASVFQAWLCLFAGLHWILMTAWIWLKGTDFGKGRLEQYLFRLVSGFIYIFVYLNVHDGPTRSRMTGYYCLVFIENTVLFAIWIIFGKPAVDLKIGASVVVFGGFVLGAVCLMLYYCCLHPSGPNYAFTVKSTLPTTQLQRPLSPKERRRPHQTMTADSPGAHTGSILELSVESETPAVKKELLVKGGNSTLSALLDSSSRGALESAWQSGMHSSSSSSNSSLDADDCSLEAFNTTSKSTYSALLGKSSSRHKHSQSQLPLSSHQPGQSEPAPPSPPPVNVSHRSTSSSRQEHDSDQLRSPSARSHGSHQSDTASVRERVSESAEEQELLDGILREEADGTEAVSDSHTPRTQSRSRLSGGRHGVHMDQSLPSAARQLNQSGLSSSRHLNQSSLSSSRQLNQSSLSSSRHLNQSSLPSSRQLNQSNVSSSRLLNQSTLSSASGKRDSFSAVAPREALGSARDQGAEPRNDSRILSPLDVGRLWSESQNRIGSSSASDIFPAERRPQRRGKNRLSQSFDLGDSESPDYAGRRVTSRSASFKTSEREAMAPYPDVVESMSPEVPQPRLYDPEDGYAGPHAGGESMWSPGLSTNNTSTSSSSRGGGGDQGASSSAPGSASRRLRDSFDSESEPPCLNAMSLQGLRGGQRGGKDSPLHRQLENRRLERLKRGLNDGLDSPASGSPSPGGSPGSTVDEEGGETSWSSMNVNENELSGLDNLTSLTPDDSLCSFASTDRGEEHRPSGLLLHAEGRQQQQALVGRGGRDGRTPAAAESGVVSGASTPSLPRSRSASSLCYDFASAGVSPSPPPGMRSGRRVADGRWVDSPSAAALDASPWRLDYLNLDPAPPVAERDGYCDRYDPREVVIELLMDQLKRASLTSTSGGGGRLRTPSGRLSPLTMSHLQESPPHRLGRSVDLFDRQAWRRLFADQDPDATLMGSAERPLGRAPSYRGDLDLMREALDLIEMQRSPYGGGFRRQTPDSASPEMYVSGQYRPPIIAQERSRAVPPPAASDDVLRQSRSRPQGSLRYAAAPSSSASLPRQQLHTPATADQPPSRQQRHHHHPHHQHSQAQMDPRRLSLPASEREGIYRYFVDSDSPIHTPAWTTPISTPATTPSHRHLLHRYLATQNSLEGGGGVGGGPLQPAQPSRPPLRQADVQRLAAALSPLPPPPPPPGGDHHRRGGGGSTTAPRRLEERLEVLTDHPDSGMHSGGSLGSASRRQPLQSLDNSPSLSPSSLTHQPVASKPLLPSAGKTTSSSSSSSRRARSSSGARSGRGGPAVWSESESLGSSPKRSSVRPRPHPAYRSGAGGGGGAGGVGDRRSAAEVSLLPASVASRTKSSDCLR